MVMHLILGDGFVDQVQRHSGGVEDVERESEYKSGSDRWQWSYQILGK